jgi:sugar phosphate permease
MGFCTDVLVSEPFSVIPSRYTSGSNILGYPSCSTIQAYAIGYFLPIILKEELGFTEVQANGLSTPPYVAAMLLMFVEGYLSDKIRLRYPFLYLNVCMNIVGLCLMVWSHSSAAQYLGTIFLTAGCSAAIPFIMVWQANNIRGTWKRAFCSASMISFGGMGGIAGSLVFRSKSVYVTCICHVVRD